MSDRFHFCISSSIVCSMIGLVFWSQIPSTSQLIPHRESLTSVNSQATINSFLDIEEGETATMLDHPSSTNRNKGKHKQYIPLNLVPEHTKNQSHQNRSGKSNLSTSNQRVVSRKLKRHLQQTEKNANELIGQSSDSFRKGLMSLVDYNLALNIAYDTKIEAANIRQVKRAKVSLLTSKQKLLRQAVEQLQNFNQPAAQGWFGDVYHAKLLLAQNQYEIASEIKDSDAQHIAIEQVTRNSDDYFSIRKIELQVGEADLSEFRRASKSVYFANQERNLFFGQDKNDSRNIAVFARGLEEIKTDVEWMASRGAGLGRSDLLEISKAQLTYVKGNYFRENKQTEKSRILFSQSMNHAKAAWSERINKYYPLGTASLHDISTSWIMWKASESKYVDLKSPDAPSLDTGIKVALDRMVNTSEMISDRRGRITSDISLIRCLKNSEILSDLKEQQSK
ncbi:MAG: hypothetical protein K0U90_17785 [Planctomycetes bacterium]|nr:hypothetical protein [Planctomycetota bacterium]